MRIDATDMYLNAWSPVGGNVWEGFSRYGLVGRGVSLGIDCEVSKAVTHSQLVLFPVLLLMSQDICSQFLLHCHKFLPTAPYRDGYGLN